MNETYVSKLHSKASSSQGLTITWDGYKMNRYNSEGTLRQTCMLNEQVQNLSEMIVVTLDGRAIENREPNCVSNFQPYLAKFRYRQGSRMYSYIENHGSKSAHAYASTVMSCGRFCKSTKGTSITFDSFQKNRNIHVTDFRKSECAGVSGIDTTGAKLLRLEMEFLRQPEVQIAGRVVQPEIRPEDAVVVLFYKATTMMNISSKGISISS